MTASNYLVTGRNKQYLLHEIRDALKNATSIEIAVSFIRMSGLSLIIQDIEDAMNLHPYVEHPSLDDVYNLIEWTGKYFSNINKEVFSSVD